MRKIKYTKERCLNRASKEPDNGECAAGKTLYSPCPFCGHVKCIWIETKPINGTVYHHVHCHQCGAEGPPSINRVVAVNKWNTRISENTTEVEK